LTDVRDQLQVEMIRLSDEADLPYCAKSTEKPDSKARFALIGSNRTIRWPGGTLYYMWSDETI
jgi:hypothetical protein